MASPRGLDDREPLDRRQVVREFECFNSGAGRLDLLVLDKANRACRLDFDKPGKKAITHSSGPPRQESGAPYRRVGKEISRFTDTNMQVSDTNREYDCSEIAESSELALDEVARIVLNRQSVPALAEVTEWLSSLVLAQRDYLRYRIFTERGYARNLIARGPAAELLLLCWRSGQRTPIHDHGGSVGVVLVCEGLLTETMFDRSVEGRVRPNNTYKWGPGSVTGAEVPDIHQLLNLQPAGKELVTLHCYAPPLSILNTYSPRSSKVGRWREAYAGGAGI